MTIKINYCKGFSVLVWLQCCVNYNTVCLAQNTSAQTNPANIKGAENIAIGVGVLALNETNGVANIGIGYKALELNTIGHSNTAVGHHALQDNRTGYANTGFGEGSMWARRFDYLNVAFGARIMRYSPDPFASPMRQNVAFGAYAMYEGETAHSNVGIGYYALQRNNNGSYNVAVGTRALRFSRGSHNTALGHFSLYHQSANDGNNTAAGLQALFQNTLGSHNVAMGNGALRTNQTGGFNVAMGTEAGYHSVGSYNIYLGYRAGYSHSGSEKLFIGNNAANTILYGSFGSRQILMGVANPINFQFAGLRTLNVRQGMLTDSLRIAPLTQWPDYVFEPGYSLQGLSDLEREIRNQKHLPGLPTRIEVEANGIELGELHRLLVKKVEELALYLVQGQEDSRSLKEKAISLEQAHAFWDKRLASLKAEIIQSTYKMD
jgi:hypothetical protein